MNTVAVKLHPEDGDKQTYYLEAPKPQLEGSVTFLLHLYDLGEAFTGIRVFVDCVFTDNTYTDTSLRELCTKHNQVVSNLFSHKHNFLNFDMYHVKTLRIKTGIILPVTWMWQFNREKS